MATYFFRNVGTAWNTSTNWSITSGGGATGAVPTNTDDVVFDTNSGNCTLTGTVGVCKSITWATYTNTYTQSATLTISGSIILGSSTTYAGSSATIINSSGTLTSNGKILPYPFTVSANATLTVAGGNNWIVTGIVTINTAVVVVINTTTTEQFEFRAGFSISAGAGNCTGTATILAAGTGTVTTSSRLSNNFTINTSGTITFGTMTYSLGTFTYITGTVNFGASTFTVPNSIGVVFNTPGLNFFNISFLGTGVTLNALLNVTNIMSFTNGQCTFDGTFGFTTSRLSYVSTPSVSNASIVLASGITYTVTTLLNLFPATNGGNLVGIKSSIPGSQAIFTLGYSANQTVMQTQVTDIDSSTGQTIWNFSAGILSNATNWNTLSSTSVQTSSAFIN